MKKAKRFLTGLLSAALALSLCAMPAMAAEDTVVDTRNPQKSTSVIDTTKKGSITIYKYNTTTQTAKGETGTGETQTPPNGATPLRGAEFTIYQVKNADWLQKYYGGKALANGEKAPEVDDYFNKDNKGVVISYEASNLVSGITAKKSQTTNDEGFAQFTNLDLGLYLVIETKKPQSVVTAVTPFLVSVPMTRVQTGNTAEGNQLKEWLYDIVVYPKNSTTTGNFTLKKYGVIGNDKENATLLAGVKFKLEHLKDGVEFNTGDAKDPNNWELIKQKAVGEQPAKDYFVTNEKGQIDVNDLKPGTYRFTEIGYEEGNDNKYIINENDQYVFVVDQSGTTVTIPTKAEHTDDYTVAGSTVSVYNYVPNVDKKVEKNGKWQEAADYSVGDSINYKIDVTIPENIERLKTFTVTDTPTGLTDKSETVVVKNDDTAIANENNSVYKVKPNGDGFIVEFVPSAMAAYKGETLTITYTAVLKDSAVTKTEGNPNKVKLNYSKNVKQNGDEKPDTDKDKKTVQDEAVVYTFKIHIDKIADDAKKTPLEGVEFDLYKQVEHGTAGTITDAEAKALGLNETEGWVKVNEEALKTNSEGILEVKGLENGTYKLVETKAKDGYNLLKAPVDVSLDIAYKTTWTETDHYEGGVWVKREVTQKKEEFKSDEASESEMNGGKQNGSKDGDGVISTTIINRKGFNLPTTGGFGTLLFSGIGVLLVVAGVGVLLSLKKKNRA